MDHQRGQGLDYLHRHPGYAAGIGRGGKPILPFQRPGASGAEPCVGKLLAVQPLACDMGIPQPIESRGHDFSWQGLGECAHNRRGQKVAYQMAAAYRGRVFGIENASPGRGYGHRPETAFIVGHIRGDGAFNPVGGVGHGVIHADINAQRNRLRGAREVHREVIPLNGDPGLYHNGLFKPVYGQGKFIISLHQLAYALAHAGLGALNDLLGQLLQIIQPELLHKGDKLPGSHLVAHDLGMQIAQHFFRGPYIGSQQLE